MKEGPIRAERPERVTVDQQFPFLMLLGRLLPRGGCSGGAALGPLCARAAIAVARQQAPAAVRRVATLPRPPAARLRQCVPMAPRVTAPARGAAVMTIVGRLGTILAGMAWGRACAEPGWGGRALPPPP